MSRPVVLRRAGRAFSHEDGDGYMDDLSGDGRADVSDVRLLYDIADPIAGEAGCQTLIGGRGTYRANDRHGPFLHVDVRGRRARWSR